MKIPSPAMPILLFRYCRHVRRAASFRRVRAIAFTSRHAWSPSGSGSGAGAGRSSGLQSRRSHSWIEVRVEEVGDEVREDHGGTEQQEQPLSIE